MWVILLIVASFLALAAWRLFVMARRGRETSRPVDSGRPDLTAVDPHGSDDR